MYRKKFSRIGENVTKDEIFQYQVSISSLYDAEKPDKTEKIEGKGEGEEGRKRQRDEEKETNKEKEMKPRQAHIIDHHFVV